MQTDSPLLVASSCALLAACFLAGCSHDAASSAPIAAAPPAERPAPPPPTAAPSATATAAPSASAAVEPPAKAGARIYSKARFAWIQPEPRPSKGWLGYLGLGSSIALRGGSVESARIPNAQSRGGCRAWYAVEPVGYICEGDAATLDPNDPVVRALAADGPRTDSPWPYDYAESLGAPRYPRPPTQPEQRRAEWDLAEHLGLVAKARAGETPDKSLLGVDLSPASESRWGPSPHPSQLLEVSPLVRVDRKRIVLGSTVAYTRQLDIDGRTYLVTHDLALIPKDRVKPYPRSEFHGVEIGKEAELPIAFFRKTDRPKHRLEKDGSFAPTGELWPRLAWVGLTGEEVKVGEVTYLATREPGTWTRSDEACVARVSPVPAVVKKAGGRKTWLDVSVLGGTLVAYEDDKPVFATLISPGRGGIPVEGIDPIETASTPTGTWRVDGKFVSATMVSSTNDQLVHTEVQYVQNFHGAHALHGAYWHDVWGEKKSGGCVNLSPIDSKRVFEWTEPTIPKDWYGLRSVKAFGPATVVLVRK